MLEGERNTNFAVSVFMTLLDQQCDSLSKKATRNNVVLQSKNKNKQIWNDDC